MKTLGKRYEKTYKKNYETLLRKVSKINLRKSEEDLTNSQVLNLRQSYSELKRNLGRT